MNAKEIETVDQVYRSYYYARKKNKMIGVIGVARENQLSLEQVKESALFLKGEKRIRFDNKEFDPVNSWAVYRLTN